METSITIAITLLCISCFAQQAESPIDGSDTFGVDSQQHVLETLEKSLYIGQYFEEEAIQEKAILADLAALFHQGVRINGKDLMLLFARDGGGWNTVTNPTVLQLVLDNYLLGPGSREDKTYWLNRMLLRAILISDPGITAVLIDSGANPKPNALRESLLHITPDYFPTYETMRLLVDELDFDLYHWCNVTPIWWLVYERNSAPERKNSQVLADELKKRKSDADLVCNTEKGGGYFLDPEIFPSDKTARELAEYYNDRETLDQLASVSGLSDHQPRVSLLRDMNQASIDAMERANLSTQIKQEFRKNDSLAAATEIITVANFNGKPEFWELRSPENGNRIFTIKYYEEPFLYEETYFEKNGKLAYAIEWRVYQRNSFNDITVWNCQYFFQNGKLINLTSMGHGKTERDDWDPESIIEMYHNRLLELEKLLK